VNEDENRPGAKFGFNTFADQLAVGTGAKIIGYEANQVK